MPPFSVGDSSQPSRHQATATPLASPRVRNERLVVERVDPDCPARTAHNSLTAARKQKCICPAAREALAAYRANERERVQIRREAERVDTRTPEQRRRAILAVPDRDPDETPPWPDLFDIGHLWAGLVRDPDAACRGQDPELWFSINPRERNEAKRICNQTCPLVDTCLTVALKAGLVGVWGGTDDDQRAAVRAQWKRTA